MSVPTIFLCALLAFAGVMRPAAALEFQLKPTAQSSIYVIATPTVPAESEKLLREWVERSAAAIVGYAGHFPVPEVYLSIRVAGGAGVYGGKAFPTDPPSMAVTVGRQTGAAALASDWVLVHELAHLFIPDLTTRERWFEEGFAGYVEAMARAQAGLRGARSTWLALERGLQNGAPSATEGGLSGARRWGRVYWASVAFMLEAELEMRADRTKMGWPVVLAAWRAQGLDIRTSASLPKLLQIGDKALGVEVLTSLYRKHALERGPWAPEQLWQRLGIVRDAKGFRFVDAPQAWLREALVPPSATAAD